MKKQTFGHYLVASAALLLASSSVQAQNWEPAIGAATALGTPNLIWQTTSDAPWVQETSSMRSSVVDEDEMSGLKTTATGPGVLSFRWKMTSNEDDIWSFGDFDFYMDGEKKRSIVGAPENNWKRVSVDIPAGEHELIWVVDATWGNVEYECLGWLDAVTLRLRAEKPEDAFQAFWLWESGMLGSRWWSEHLISADAGFTGMVQEDAGDVAARVYRAVTTIAKLAENANLHGLFGDFGGTLDVETLAATFAFTGTGAPSVNQSVDRAAAELLPALDAALADLDVVPVNWAGTVDIAATESGFDENISIDVGDVLAAKSVLHSARSAILIAQAYDLNMDYAKTNVAERSVEPPYATPYIDIPDRAALAQWLWDECYFLREFAENEAVDYSLWIEDLNDSLDELTDEYGEYMAYHFVRMDAFMEWWCSTNLPDRAHLEDWLLANCPDLAYCQQNDYLEYCDILDALTMEFDEFSDFNDEGDKYRAYQDWLGGLENYGYEFPTPHELTFSEWGDIPVMLSVPVAYYKTPDGDGGYMPIGLSFTEADVKIAQTENELLLAFALDEALGEEPINEFSLSFTTVNGERLRVYGDLYPSLGYYYASRDFGWAEVMFEYDLHLETDDYGSWLEYEVADWYCDAGFAVGSWFVLSIRLPDNEVALEGVEFDFTSMSLNVESRAVEYYGWDYWASGGKTRTVQPVNSFLCDHPDFMKGVRDATKMPVAKESLRASLETALDAHAAVTGRTDSAWHFIEYDPAFTDDWATARQKIAEALASLDAPQSSHLCYTNMVKHSEWNEEKVYVDEEEVDAEYWYIVGGEWFWAEEDEEGWYYWDYRNNRQIYIDEEDVVKEGWWYFDELDWYLSVYQDEIGWYYDNGFYSTIRLPVEIMNQTEVIHLGAFFESPYLTRAMLPRFSQDNVVLAGTFPDPAFGGILPGWTVENPTENLQRMGVAVDMDYMPEITFTTPVPVPHAWLDGFYSGLVSAQDYESKAKEKGANGMWVWESYVVDCDPDALDTRFRIIRFEADPVTSVHAFEVYPHSLDRVYRVQGKTNLTDSIWLPYPETQGLRFFHVNVSVE